MFLLSLENGKIEEKMNKLYDVKKLELSVLEETSGNPQSMSEGEFKGLVESIKEKGFILDDPVIWEYEVEKYRIISGHHRIKAARQAGYKELNCKILNDLTEKQARLLVVEANKRRGDFDGVKYEQYMQDVLSDFEIDFDEINNEIGVIAKEIIETNEIESNLQQESKSLKLTISFESFEEKEEFVNILDYYGGRGRGIKDKLKNFVSIILRDQKKEEENEGKEV